MSFGSAYEDTSSVYSAAAPEALVSQECLRNLLPIAMIMVSLYTSYYCNAGSSALEAALVSLLATHEVNDKLNEWPGADRFMIILKDYCDTSNVQ